MTRNWTRDSLTNFVTGLGTMKDPTTASCYALNILTRDQLENAYRGDWVARRIVDAPAEDMTREWRSWQASQDQIEKIEELEKRFNIQQKVKQALIRARLYGGAALVLGVEQGNSDEELDPESVGADDLRFVVVMSRWELSAGPRIYDVQSPWFTRPEYYTVATPTENVNLNGPQQVQGMIRIHPSRVVEFVGNELPDWRLAPLGGTWGDSVLQPVDDVLKDFGLTVGGIANMVNDAKMDVIKIPDFSKKMANDDYANLLLKRFAYANVSKSTINSLLLDTSEEWERITTNFGGVPQVLQTLLPIVAGAGGIPVSRLVGQSPAKGLGNTSGGESDLRNYYDDITSKQKVTLAPAMSMLDQVLVRSALGTYDPSIYYEWTPLYQPDPKELADIAFSKAQATNLDVQMALINEDALRAARINQLIEDGTYPGLDDAVDEFGAEPPEPTPEELAAYTAMMQGNSSPPAKPVSDPSQVTQDSAPRTLYVRRDVMNKSDITRWAKANGLGPVQDDLHVTIAYSRTPIDWSKVGEAWSQDSKTGQMVIAPGGPRQVLRFGEGAIVLVFSSNELRYRHDDIERAGATWDHPEYEPHITITYVEQTTTMPADYGRDLSDIEPYRGPIVLGPEIFEEVRDA